ncbi:MAG: DNA polymerase III subunit delta [bacterium]|nr:DNA polymerase III subunit delta [bacterium]
MPSTSHAFEPLLGREIPSELPAVVVAFGDDGFLRKEVVQRILQSKGIDTHDLRSFDGDLCQWLDVHDELATLSLFESNSRRIAVVQNADRLVKDARAQLEKWCSAPATSSLLVLQLASFPSNTKLFKTVQKIGWCVNCSLPTASARSKAADLAKLKQWMAEWSEQEHALKLKAAQLTMIVDAVGTDCGMLHQELGKLALYCDEQGVLSNDKLRENLGTWRTRTMWEIADAIVDGRVAEALAQVDKVFAAGEHAAAVVPQISWSLRRYGRAAHLLLQAKRTHSPLTTQAAISQAGFWGADAKLAEQRLRRLGLKRGCQILDWLLELDLKIKGSHSQPSRAIFAIEQLCLRFA